MRRSWCPTNLNVTDGQEFRRQTHAPTTMGPKGEGGIWNVPLIISMSMYTSHGREGSIKRNHSQAFEALQARSIIQ